MNEKIKNIFISLLVLSGIFCFGGVWNGENENGTIYVAQLSFFLLVSGLLGAYLVFTKNKLFGTMACLLSFGAFKTFLFDQAPRFCLYESFLIGYSFFIIYYFIRHFEVKSDILKYFLIPACFNIVLIYVQKFDNSSMAFINDETTGFLGNGGMTSAYLALCCPIFLRYWKLGYLFCLSAIIMCNGSVGLIAGIVSGLFYLFFKNKKLFLALLVSSIIGIGSVFTLSQGIRENALKDAQLRVSMLVGTLDGIRHNSVLGWGVGSFIPIISQVKPEDSEYFGRRFNTSVAIMNNPHNELLSGWWKVGIGFPILAILLLLNLIKKFSEENVFTFSILISALIISMGWFFTPPALLILIISIGIYENQALGDKHGKKYRKTDKRCEKVEQRKEKSVISRNYREA